eukprot:IDg9004t1
MGAILTPVWFRNSGVYFTTFLLYADCTIAAGFAIVLFRVASDTKGCMMETSIMSSPTAFPIARMSARVLWSSHYLGSTAGFRAAIF